MVKPIRISATLTAIGLVAALAACSTTGSKQAMTGTTLFGKVDTSNIGLATRAQLALSSNDVVGAISLAERAVDHTPNDAGFRALLGNCYLAAGRFASAEQAYSDSLSLFASQPQIALKLALTKIALGKGDEAADLIGQASPMLDASDAGLALALAGHADQAVALLEPAARDTGADARLRQNLALAYAMSGNWDSARVVAAQDIPGDQLDARMKDWMALATPGQKTSKVAAFIGVTPAASDAGQPTRLALVKLPHTVQQAEAAAPRVRASVVSTPVVPVPASVPAPVVAQVQAHAPAASPVQIAAPTVVASSPSMTFPLAPIVQDVAAPAPRVRAAALRVARPSLTPVAARLTQSVGELHRSAFGNGGSRAVVQLGAYSSRERVAAAWSHVVGKYGALRRLQPVTARFDGPQGTVYRLAVHGFGNGREALSLCNTLKRAGGSCFVRAVSGDAPVQLASR